MEAREETQNLHLVQLDATGRHGGPKDKRQGPLGQLALIQLPAHGMNRVTPLNTTTTTTPSAAQNWHPVSDHELLEGTIVRHTQELSETYPEP